MTPRRFDFLVAGTGAAGAAVAGRLAAGGARTILVERGPRERPALTPLESVYANYTEAGLTAAVGNALLPVPTGSGLGGTTAINSGTCMRTPAPVLARWESAVKGFDAREFASWQDEAWEALRVRRAPPETASGSTRLFLEGLRRLGVGGAELLDRAETGCAGDGRCCFVCARGAKVTSDRAFLAPLNGSADLTLECGAELRTVLPARARGGPVEALVSYADGDLAEIRCRAAILCCGTLATPSFLRALGLGAGDELSLHPAAEVFGLFESPVEGWRGVPQGAGLDDPEEPRLRYEGAFLPRELAALAMPLEGRGLRWWMDRYAHVAAFGFMIRDSSRGSVRHPLGARLPWVRYSMNPEDLRLMARGMRFVGRALFSAGARRVLLPVHGRRSVFEGPEELEREDLSTLEPRDLQMMAFHPLGTCGLGRVVGADLMAAPGVYVCDGSVVPESLGVNPQMTIYAFALGLARRLLAS